MLQAGRRPGPAAATCRESPPRKSRPCPPPTTPLPMTVARRRRMIKDHYVPRRNQPGQRLLGAQRSQLPPAVHLARRPAAASPRSAGSEVHPARQCAGGWARCLRDPCPGIARMARYVNAARQVPARCPRVASVRGGALARQVTSRGLGALGGGLTGRVAPHRGPRNFALVRGQPLPAVGAAVPGYRPSGGGGQDHLGPAVARVEVLVTLGGPGPAADCARRRTRDWPCRCGSAHGDTGCTPSPGNGQFLSAGP